MKNFFVIASIVTAIAGIGSLVFVTTQASQPKASPPPQPTPVMQTQPSTVQPTEPAPPLDTTSADILEQLVKSWEPPHKSK